MGALSLLIICMALIAGLISSYKSIKLFLKIRNSRLGDKKNVYKRRIKAAALLGWGVSILPSIAVSFAVGGTLGGSIFERIGDSFGVGEAGVLTGLLLGVFVAFYICTVLFSYFFLLIAELFTYVCMRRDALKKFN